MAPAHFGTDGVRGVANAELSAALAVALGTAAARVIPGSPFLIGRDTRRSGPFLQAALSAGLAAGGADVVDVGVLPTPGVAACAERRGLPAAVVSASHNPYPDNGIKLFAPGGTKLSDDQEAAVEAEIDAVLAGAGRWPTGRGVGRLWADPSAADDYRRHLAGVIAPRRLDGLRVVVDCANGAAVGVAPEVFAAAGADVSVVAVEPNGENINDRCGSTHPETLAAEVVRRRADLGLALDGDADRVVAVDHTGAVADGDVLLALFATDLADRGALTGNTVVVTVMTNLGFRMAMAERGIGVLETPVGDRHVLAALEARSLAIGGEQSGHIVFRHFATTGDGILSGLILADLVVRSGRPLAELSRTLVVPVPQVLVNVAVDDPAALEHATAVWEAVAAVEDELDGSGRVVLRASGTEPVVRVMVEATDGARAAAVAERLCQAVGAALGRPSISPVPPAR